MIKTISLKNITQSYFEKIILDAVSFKCTEEEKICIVGENGTGKSTLLKIIAGTNEPTVGNIEKNAHIRCFYVSQEFAQADMPLSIEAYIQKHAGTSLFKKVFTIGATIGFDLEKHKEKLCNSLSGGQQKVLSLSVGLATQPDFLLLDEPENHLDIVSRMELITLLQNYQKGILFVSHDRMMIDSIATKVAEVTGKKIHISEGGYQGYINARLSRIAGMQREYDQERKRIKEIKESLHILQMKAFRGKNQSLYHARKEEMEALKEKHAESGRPEDKQTRIKINSHGPEFHSGKLLCRIKDASYKYESAKGDTFRDVSLEMRTGSHIILLGRNGSGKSTFFKCLTGDLSLTKGTVTWTEGIKSVYFDQHMEFDGAMTPVEIVVERLACHDDAARAAL
jgi:ATPase subunit of ABC transporter with duplicated ATPase domains